VSKYNPTVLNAMAMIVLQSMENKDPRADKLIAEIAQRLAMSEDEVIRKMRGLAKQWVE